MEVKITTTEFDRRYPNGTVKTPGRKVTSKVYTQDELEIKAGRDVVHPEEIRGGPGVGPDSLEYVVSRLVQVNEGEPHPYSATTWMSEQRFGCNNAGSWVTVSTVTLQDAPEGFYERVNEILGF